MLTRALRPSLAAHSPLLRRYHNLNDIWTPSQQQPQQPHPHTKARSRPAEDVPLLLVENKCAHIKMWDFLRNPAEALTLIRAVEQKYGPVESFLFQKDFDNPNLYQVHVKVTFRDIASFYRIPEPSETLHVRAPKVEKKRSGGIGLDEMQHVFSDDKVEFLTSDQVTEMGSEGTIDFRIERAKRANYQESPYRFTGSNHQFRKVVGSRMLEWGGFHKMNPIDSTTPITNEDLTSNALDHVHMRRALREWATYLNVRNPFETYPEDKPRAAKGGTRGPEVNASEAAKVEKQPEQTPALGEWVPLDAGESRAVREPFDQMIGLEDANAASRTITEPSIEDISTDTVSKEQPPSLELNATQTAAEPTPTTTEALTPPSAVPPLPQPQQASLSPEDSNSMLLASEPTRTQLPSTSYPPTRPMSRPTKPKVDQKELQSQLERARKIAATVRSFEKKRVAAGRKDEQAERTVQEKQQVQTTMLREKEEESVAEQNPRFSELFSKLQNVFRR